MMRTTTNLGRVSALLIAGSAFLAAQGTQTATVVGEIRDTTGVPQAGVTIRLASPSLQGVRTVVSDSKGRFRAPLLPPGAYTITVTKEGYQTLKSQANLGLGQSFEPRLTIAKIGSAVVEVVAASSDVDKTDVKVATNYRLDTVDKLPTANRTMETVAFLTPGVTTGVGDRVQIHGAMTTGNLYLMDGQNISDNTYNNRGVRLIDDSIEEVQVITGAISAEYGDVDGGVLNAITRSGSNEFEGQMRWELSNPSWNAYQPLQSRTANNLLSEEKTISIRGPILKDRIWFAASFFSTDQNDNGTIKANIPATYYLPGTYAPDPNQAKPTDGDYVTGNGPTGKGSLYDTSHKEVRRQIKVTGTINQDHVLVASFQNAEINDLGRNYSAGETRGLVPQKSTSEFWNLAWRAVWSDAVVSELKHGEKKQNLSAGADPINGSPVYNYDNGYYYNNGIFSNVDGGDNRNNQTWNGKVSVFWSGLGDHQTDTGFDYYKGTHRAKNDQSCTGYIFGVDRMNLANQTAFGADVWTFTSVAGDANSFSDGLYINDKWTVNPHLVLNLGLRRDHFKAENESGQSTAGASGWSPRLGAKYDILADGRFVAGLSYARYNSKVLETITNSVTSQGNPTEIDHPYIGAAGPQTFAYLTDLSEVMNRYDFSTPLYYSDPKLNVRLSDDLKAPTVDEWQASFGYSFNNPTIGIGKVTLTGVHKEWKNLFDYTVGNSGTVQTPAGDDVYCLVWKNSSVATRKYQSIELQGDLAKGDFQFSGSITWSKLWGNYEGESSNSPGRGEGLENFTTQDGVQMYDRSVTAPMGWLSGHTPLRARFMGSYVRDNSYGRTTWGLIYRFDSGEHYSATRTINPTDLNANIAGQYGTSATQYLGGRGQAGVFNASSYLDLSITHDFNLFKVGGKKVDGFVKLVIPNFLNHQQQLSWNTQYRAGKGLGLDAPFTPADAKTFGKPVSSNDYGYARSILISTGFKF